MTLAGLEPARDFSHMTLNHTRAANFATRPYVGTCPTFYLYLSRARSTERAPISIVILPGHLISADLHVYVPIILTHDYTIPSQVSSVDYVNLPPTFLNLKWRLVAGGGFEPPASFWEAVAYETTEIGHFSTPRYGKPTSTYLLATKYKYLEKFLLVRSFTESNR